jgi:hypothetical protein
MFLMLIPISLHQILAERAASNDDVSASEASKLVICNNYN